VGNGKEHSLPFEAVCQVVARHARSAPEAIAVIAEDGELTYAELDSTADQFAAAMRANGVRDGDVVAIAGRRSARTAAAMLGVLRVGAAYLPLDPEHPVARIQYAIRDCGVSILGCVNEADSELASTLGVKPVEAAREVGAEGIAVAADVCPADRAYVIYTSGSTGRPKGVAVTHGNLVGMLSGCREKAGVTSRDVFSLAHSFAFDFSVWELWGALSSGARTIILSRDVVRAPRLLLDSLSEHFVTVLSQTPTAFRALAHEADDMDVHPAALALRCVILGGEALRGSDLNSWIARFGDERPELINMYGITETTVHVTHRKMRAADLEQPATSPIGSPLPGYRVDVLGADGLPVEEGDIGEAYVGGAGIAAGYLGRPGLTAERFLPDPAVPGGRRYRSGDLVRLGPTGVEYVGRADRQVKVRGFRVELGETEAAIQGVPGVRAAVADVVRADGGESQLVAYVQHDAAAWDPRDLRRILARSLPEYLQPNRFIRVDEIPRTGNGKVDTLALAEIAAALEDSGPSLGDGPATERERLLAHLWCSVLGKDQIDRDDSFFDLGGNSLSAVRVAAAARKAGLGISVRAILRYQTLRRIAAAAVVPPGDSSQAPHSDSFGLLEESERAKVPPEALSAYPMTSMQEGMIAEQEKPGKDLLYQVTGALKVAGTLDQNYATVAQLAARLAGQHEILRTIFDLTSYGRPVQVVLGDVQPQVGFVDIAAYSLAGQEAAVQHALDDELSAPLRVEGGLGWRLKVLRLGPRTCQVLFTHSHAILDGWSVALIMDQIRRELRGEQAFSDEVLPLFRDYVAAELSTAADESARMYWTTILDKYKPAKLRRRFSAGPAAAPVVAAELCGLADEARDFARTLRVPWKHVMLAVHLAAVRAVTGCRDAYTGLVTNGRLTRTGADQALGLFLNTVPFATPPDPENWSDLVRQVHLAEQEMHSYRRFPLAAMRGTSGARPSLDICFNYVDFAAAGIGDDDDSLSEHGFPAFPISVHLRGGCFIVEGNPRYADDALCQELASAHVAALRSMITDPAGFVAGRLPEPGSASAITSPDSGEDESPRPPYEAPITEYEVAIARLWSELLGVSWVGRRDSFFRLGGDSILAVRAMSRLSVESGRPFGLGIMFEAADLAELAAAVQAVAST
jgi:amino acid adenylation domain-containing protein